MSSSEFILHIFISGDGVVDICSRREITEQSGYIKSSHYPKNYPPTHQCNITIKAHATQRIRLFAIDLDLASVAGKGDGQYLIPLLHFIACFKFNMWTTLSPQ